jgi:ornithine cyclodeaminase/alanine dehydrogenase-like protein (mu-crystallin family)
MPLYLSEDDIDALLTPADAVAAVEGCFERLAAGQVENRPRYRIPVEGGLLHVMAAVDLGLGLAGSKTYVGGRNGSAFVITLFDAVEHRLVAVIEADRLGQLRTGAASAVAAKHLARSGARTLGIIGTGWQAQSQVSCIRAAVPSIERVLAYGRNPERLAAFCKLVGAEPAESNHEASEQDIVVTMTTSKDPVVRGEWLQPGALVCAAGANRVQARELDNVVLQRAAFVCCDSLEQAKGESGDLVEPVAAGILDWLEVHELHEVVGGTVVGRQSDDDIVVFKSNGLAAWDVALAAVAVERARERGAGLELPARAPRRA